MKKVSLFMLAGAVALGMASCGDASSKVKTEETTTNTPAATAAAVTAEVVDAENAPVFVFNEEKHDFGSIESGSSPKTAFTFTNTGKSPLIITNAKGSCGCTVPVWPKEPIAPGATGEIQVQFNSGTKKGNQTKTVTLTANTVPNTKVLTITAQIQPKPEEAGASISKNTSVN
jgi:hypothetical protein